MTDIDLFKLPENFISRFRNAESKLSYIGNFVFRRTYSRFKENLNRNELWYETIQRVVEGVFNYQISHFLKNGIQFDMSELKNEAKEMYELIWNLKFIPPGRGLWICGTDFIKKKGNAALNSCAFCSTYNIDKVGSKPFRWAMDMLMLGVGIGFDTRGANSIEIKQPKYVDKTYIIEDSREGWCDALSIVLESFFKGNELPNFDYSKIRKKGERISGFGGKASGPDPLMELLSNVNNILSERIGNKITSEDIVDIFNNIGKCVIAGNVRRSAQIAIGSNDDDLFLNIKDPKNLVNQKIYRSYRWASNNTVLAEVGKTDYDKIISKIVKNGEPGILWLENARKFSRMIDPPDWKDKNAMGTNPCSEQTLENYEVCNLAEIVLPNMENFEDFKKSLYFAYLYSKSITLLPSHWKETDNIIKKNRRLGISLTGITAAYNKFGRNTMVKWMQKGYKFLREIDKEISKKWKISESIKLTTVKPSGTIGLLAGVPPGVHYPHSKYYIRRIRIESSSPLCNELAKLGFNVYYDKNSAIYQKDNDKNIIYDDNNEPIIEKYDTKIIEFPIKEKNFKYGKYNVSIFDQLRNIMDLQRFWSDNQVSATITFKKEEIDQLPILLQIAESQLKSISFMPLDDTIYDNPPYEEIDEKKYNKMVSKIKYKEFKSQTHPIGEKYCNTDFCELKN